MRRLLRRIWFRIRWFIGRFIAALLLIAFFLWLVGPYERANLTASFDPRAFGGDVSGYFAAQEARFGDLRPGAEKRVIWAGGEGEQTDWAVLYVHGFSASAQEIRPVPDLVAKGLGANLIFTRLQGHGRSSPNALAEATVEGWMRDVAEGLAAARAVGDRVLVISTSTGGTLLAAAALQQRLMTDVQGIVFVSPNFGINNVMAPLLTWPAARFWLPLVAGERRSFEPRNEEQAKNWTYDYPTVAVLPMAALVQKVTALDFSLPRVPALFVFSTKDQVVRPDATARIAKAWGAPVKIVNPNVGPEDDRSAHVIAGDIVSPGQTEAAARTMLDWARALPRR